MIKDEFEEALIKNDIERLQEIPKSDVHNHAGRGGAIKDLSKNIQPPSKYFDSLDDMQDWFVDHVKRYCPPGIDGYLYRVEAAFKQAARDQIERLSLSFGSGEIHALGGIQAFSKVIVSMKEQYIPDHVFIPELSLLRGAISDEEIDELKAIIDYGYFQSLDICGNEMKGSLKPYQRLYRYAKDKGIMLKAHIGEFGSSEDVKRGVEILELDEIHHGIAAADSYDVMKFLADHQIILNICPTSNIMLKRVKKYADHPIGILYDEGVNVTINTDDLAIFNASVSEEYLHLYNHDVLSAKALNNIRLGGLCSYNKYEFK